MSRASIDIAIVNYRSANDTLQALARLANWPNGTIWLVDNSAHEPDMTAQTAALQQASATMPWVVLLTTDSNLGFGRACNLAFSRSTADFFLLLNPDAEISTDDVNLLARSLLDHPRLGAVSPKMYWNRQNSFVLPPAFGQTPTRRVAWALATWTPALTRWAAQFGLTRARSQMASHAICKVHFLAGSVMMLRRNALRHAGGLFDPDFFMFFEDSDLSVRLRRSGYELAVVTAASAVHEYRHKAFKAGLMATAEQQYYRKRFPAFFRWSCGLTRVAALARPFDLTRWFTVMPQPVRSAKEFAELTGSEAVLAFSPSMLMMPAIFRPDSRLASCFNDDEWALLEPAVYVALLTGSSETAGQRWVCFERSADVTEPVG